MPTIESTTTCTNDSSEDLPEAFKAAGDRLDAIERHKAAVAAAALRAYDRGLNVIPTMDDRSKRPLGAWSEQIFARPSREETEKAHKSAWGTGILFGNVWDGDALAPYGIELFEFDDADAYEAFLAAAGDDPVVGPVVDRIRDGYEETTPGGGVHLLYFCETVEGNQKLAQRPKRNDERRVLEDGIPDPDDAVKTLSETRGRRGFGIIHPSGGWTHPSGRPYVLRRGGLEHIATITPEERKALLDRARSFDEMPKQNRQQKGDNKRQEGKPPPDGKAPSSRPGDAYCRTKTWDELLLSAGWTQVRTDANLVSYWRRPGAATDGHDATTNVGGTDRLYVHSSSVEGLEAGRYYTKFEYFVHVEHGGDFKAAAADLRAQGYGKGAGEGNDGDRSEESKRHRLTDVGNAERLAEQHGADHRYCAERKIWLMWDGTRWVDDVTGEIHRQAIQTVRAIPQEAEGVTDRDAWAAIMRHALASENAARLAAMVKIAQSLAAFAVRVDEFDSDPWLLNTPSGTVDMRKGTLEPHDRADLITRITGAAYVPGATSEKWDDFLVAATEGIDVAAGEREPTSEERARAAEIRSFLQRLAGMSATGDASEEVAPLLHGPERSGKSTLVSAVTKALGGYAVTTDFDTFLKRKQPGGIRTDLVRLNRAHMVASVEVEDGRELAAALFKRITGGDEQTARGLYTSEIVIQPTATFWLVANHAPRIDADDGAMWRRILHVPFPHTVPPHRRDAGVKRYLTDPEGGGPAVLAWLVEGALAWKRDGLRVPESITAATADLRNDMDATSGFFEDRCELDPMATAQVSTLHMSYLDWARHLGVREPLDRKRFGEHLTTRHGCTRGRGTGSQHVWRGVRLLPAHDPESVTTRPVNPFAPPAQEAAMPHA